ncbi:SPOR domain-containing protein [Ignavibacterium album]|uniref:SPOR domain-containing protein n=1 Tax=Ignavibacterium album TaxID=591197 RepID=UPI00143BA0F3|nr:SPOR domain-containing protein [Ignavibacterium album]
MIKKISRKAGIPDSDVKLFFEILLKHLSSMLKIGQAAYLKKFGYFFLLKGKINQSRLNFIDENVPDTFIDFILFSLNKDLKSSIEEGLIFNVPTIDDDDFQIVDTYFSLSIGKPLIPIRGTSSDEFYVPTGGYELRRLIESKVEKIISEVEILNAYESNPPQIILTSQAFNSNRISLEMTEPELKLDEEIPDSFFETGEVKKEETLRIEHVAWDFGIDLSKEIEEETIIDFQESESDANTELIAEKNITQKEPEQITPDEIEQTVEEIINEDLLNIKDKIKSEETSVASDESEPIGEIIDDSKSEEAIELEITEEPPAVIPDLEIHESIDELIIENPEPEKVEFEYENNEKEDELKASALFKEVKPEDLKTEDEQKEFEEVESPLPLIDFDKQKQKDKISDKFEVVNEVVEEKSEEEISPLRMQDEEVKDTPFDEDKELKKIREELYSYQPKKSRVPLLIVIFGSIVIIAMLYFYITQIKNVATKQTQPIVSLKTDNATIVERDFSVPVSYPYPKKEIEETTEPVKIDSSKIETNQTQVSSENKTVEKSETKEPVEQKNIVETKTQQLPKETLVSQPSVSYERVAPNIYKYKDYYVVQVAAFRSNSIAENEAAKFRNKGFNSFVEKAEIQGMGVWFRVRVGNFPTLKEAQEFQSRIKL